MSEDSDYCEVCGENFFHRKNSPECFMLQAWKADCKKRDEYFKQATEAAKQLSKLRAQVEIARKALSKIADSQTACLLHNMPDCADVAQEALDEMGKT